MIGRAIQVARARLTALPAPALTVLAVALAGCASPQSYVVLLNNEDGTAGKVQVSSAAGTTVLTTPRSAALLGGTAAPPFVVSDEMLKRDFGSALAASPAAPTRFLLYFEKGGEQLTAASLADIPKIVAEVRRRAAPDISIIGHTDTTGSDDINERLGLTRARLVAGLLGEARLDADHTAIESHGKKNMLVRTPDNTDEPRNRRVEVTVR